MKTSLLLELENVVVETIIQYSKDYLYNNNISAIDFAKMLEKKAQNIRDIHDEILKNQPTIKFEPGSAADIKAEGGGGGKGLCD